MGSENPDDFEPAVVLTDEDQQEIGGLINSDGEEVDFSHLGEYKTGAALIWVIDAIINLNVGYPSTT